MNEGKKDWIVITTNGTYLWSCDTNKNIL